VKYRVFFIVQHLLGIGHVMRSKRITKALLDAGFEVDIILGGTQTPATFPEGAKCFQLSPYKAGPGGFSDLVDENNNSVDEIYKQDRLAQLLALLQARSPHIIFTEAFPFARHQLDFEFIPLLEAAQKMTPKPYIACSVRDLLHKKVAPGRDERTVELLRRYYDFVFLHADPDFADLSGTFRFADEISDLTHYTGLVTPDEDGRRTGQAYDVVVSAGGGAVGKPLFEAALQAMQLTRYAKDKWGFITGPNLPQETVQMLKSAARPNLIVEHFRPDFSAMLKDTKVLVSQSGYNTSSDILRAGCRSVLVPYVQEGLTEQTDRANLFEQRGLSVHLAEVDMDAKSLAAAIDKAGEMPPPEPDQIPNLNGAFETARILQKSMISTQPCQPLLTQAPA
jgi:predicted glycosyltransferase